MADLNKQALEMWNSMKPMIDREIEQQTKGTVQRRKAKVTTAPSLVTKKIGVTEPFGDQYFIPYDAKVAGANVGDVVWVEYMYGASNAFASMFAKAVEDPRSCSATLSSAGWYRVLKIDGAGLQALTNGYRGSIITIKLMTSRGAGNRTEEHEIKLFAGSNNYPFINEVSVSTTLWIDKIRYTYSAGSDYTAVDIHFIGTSATNVTACFTVDVDPTGQQYITAESLQSVADAPSGEAVLVSYDFHADISSTVKDISSAVTLNYDPLHKWIYVHDGMVDMFIETYFANYVADNEYIIGTITSPYRPSHLIVTTGHTTDANFNPKGLVTFVVYTNGNLGVRVNNTVGNYIFVHATYPIF